jgi:hypothetical protein
VEYQVTTDNVEPFWRRLEKAFKYPLNANAMMMIVGLSVFSVIISSLPFQGLIALLLNLFIAGVTVNYSFLCLTKTSEGDMNAPSISDALSNSFGVLWKLFLMILVVGLGLGALAANVSPLLAGIALVVVFIGLPSILMCFAHSQSVLESLNPFNFVRLMTTVGAPYIVLVLFLFIMMSSVGILSNFIGEELVGLSTILQASVSNYYAVVSFHLMGYLLFQYQGKLGYSTADAEEEILLKAEPADVTLAHVNIRLKEGDFARVSELLKDAIDVTNRDKRLWARYFDVLYRTENSDEMALFADKYLNHLVETAQTDKLVSDYKKIKQLRPTYSPKLAHVRYHVASVCRTTGDALSAVQLINGMHKQFPDYEKLVASYHLMKLALDDLPNMEAQSAKCLAMVKQLQAKYPEQSIDGKETKPVTYEVKEPTALMAAAKPAEISADTVSNSDSAEGAEAPKDLAPIEFK